jgi:hypothetical protein
MEPYASSAARYIRLPHGDAEEGGPPSPTITASPYTRLLGASHVDASSSQAHNPRSLKGGGHASGAGGAPAMRDRRALRRCAFLSSSQFAGRKGEPCRGRRPMTCMTRACCVRGRRASPPAAFVGGRVRRLAAAKPLGRLPPTHAPLRASAAAAAAAPDTGA